jgi:3-oxoacyl-[acyl-carrier protein] reductase
MRPELGSPQISRPHPENQQVTGRFANAVPLERLGTPADIAFLASPSGRWVNGQTIRVNGGMN